MNFVVYHLKHSRDTLPCFELSEEKLLEIKTNWETGRYKKVLVRDVAPPKNVIELLERAFGYTNSIDELWTKNFEDKDLPDGPEQRSTSTSDIIQVGDKYYICMMCGWEKVKV